MSGTKNYWADKVEPKLHLIAGWARNGLDNVQIANNLGIGPSTFEYYMKMNRKLRSIVEENRLWCNLIVENSLFKKATGYQYDEVTKERRKVVDDEGRWTGDYAMRVVKRVTKEVQPNLEAIQYWLERRDTARWQPKPASILDLDSINTGIVALAELLSAPLPERKIGSENDD